MPEITDRKRMTAQAESKEQYDKTHEETDGVFSHTSHDTSYPPLHSDTVYILWGFFWL